MKKLFNHTKRPDRNWEEDVQDGYDWDEEEYTGEDDGEEYYADEEEYPEETDGEEYYADEEEYSHGNGQHHQDHDLHSGAGKCKGGGRGQYFRLCSHYAQGKALCEKGGALYGKRTAVFPDAGKP